MEANYFAILRYLPYIEMNHTWLYTCPPLQTPVPPSSTFHPSGLNRSTGFEGSFSCIELGLVIYFTRGNIHVPMQLSQIIPPYFCPQIPKVCSLHLCYFFVSPIESLLPSLYIPYICINILYQCFSFWLYFTLYNGLQFHSPN